MSVTRCFLVDLSDMLRSDTAVHDGFLSEQGRVNSALYGFLASVMRAQVTVLRSIARGWSQVTLEPSSLSECGLDVLIDCVADCLPLSNFAKPTLKSLLQELEAATRALLAVVWHQQNCTLALHRFAVLLTTHPCIAACCLWLLAPDATCRRRH
jgi:hypothetical protein